MTPYEIPNSFTEKLRNFTSSQMFLTGIILYTAGNILPIILTFNIFSVFSLVLLALPIAGFWMLYADSKNPESLSKIKTALTLFKASIIVDLVMMCLVVVLVILVGLAVFAFAAFRGNSNDPIILITIVIVIILFVFIITTAFLIIYFILSLKVVDSLKIRLINDSSAPLKGITVFSVMAYVYVGFMAFGALSTGVIGGLWSGVAPNFWANNFMQEFNPGGMNGYEAIYLPGMPVYIIIMVSAVCLLAVCAGIVLCVITLNRFNRSLFCQEACN